MKQLLLVFLHLFPVLLMAQEEKELASPNLVLKVPILNAGLAMYLNQSESADVQNEASVDFFGAGLWYFNQTKFSYELDFSLNNCLGQHQTYRLLTPTGPVIKHSSHQDFNFISSYSSFTVNYELFRLKSYSFFPFLKYQLHLEKWRGGTATIPGESTWISDDVYRGLHYESVFGHKITSQGWAHCLHLGMAFMDFRDLINFRFFFGLQPPIKYTYNLRPLGSAGGPGSPVFKWTVASKTALSIGASISINVALSYKKEA